jgi:hypothetical protein
MTKFGEQSLRHDAGKFSLAATIHFDFEGRNWAITLASPHVSFGIPKI